MISENCLLTRIITIRHNSCEYIKMLKCHCCLLLFLNEKQSSAFHLEVLIVSLCWVTFFCQKRGQKDFVLRQIKAQYGFVSVRFDWRRMNKEILSRVELRRIIVHFWKYANPPLNGDLDWYLSVSVHRTGSCWKTKKKDLQPIK